MKHMFGMLVEISAITFTLRQIYFPRMRDHWLTLNYRHRGIHLHVYGLHLITFNVKLLIITIVWKENKFDLAWKLSHARHSRKLCHSFIDSLQKLESGKCCSSTKLWYIASLWMNHVTSSQSRTSWKSLRGMAQLGPSTIARNTALVWGRRAKQPEVGTDLPWRLAAHCWLHCMSGHSQHLQSTYLHSILSISIIETSECQHCIVWQWAAFWERGNGKFLTIKQRKFDLNLPNKEVWFCEKCSILQQTSLYLGIKNYWNRNIACKFLPSTM